MHWAGSPGRRSGRRTIRPLDRIRANTLARNWSALYQQRPTPDEGEMFVPERITVRRRVDDVVLWVRAWDLAGSKDGDWTVGVLMGRTASGTIVIGNVNRMRGRPNEVANEVLRTAKSDTNKIKIAMAVDPTSTKRRKPRSEGKDSPS